MQVGELKTFLKKGVKTDEISLEDWFFKQVKDSSVEIRDKHEG